MPVHASGTLYFAQEQWEYARNKASALEYARSERYNLVPEGGSQKYFHLKEHDSMLFTADGRWFWNSHHLAGGAIEFIMNYEGRTKVEAVLQLSGTLEQDLHQQAIQSGQLGNKRDIVGFADAPYQYAYTTKNKEDRWNNMQVIKLKKDNEFEKAIHIHDENNDVLHCDLNPADHIYGFYLMPEMLVGYVSLCDQNTPHQDMYATELFEEYREWDKNFIYINQIAVKRDAQNARFGRSMYLRLFSLFPNTTFYSHVSIKNIGSLIMHTKTGFNIIGQFASDDFCGDTSGYRSYLMRKKKE